jgi:hypothetical protein
MGNITILVPTGHINLSPVLFQLSARDYFKCYLAFEKSEKFSAVPFFLCCRAIELALKAKHLESKSRKEIKQLCSHNLMKSYSELDSEQHMLLEEELELLAAANEIYVAKEFEYLNVFDAATAYKRFPDLEKLGTLTRKIIAYDT